MLTPCKVNVTEENGIYASDIEMIYQLEQGYMCIGYGKHPEIPKIYRWYK